MKTGHSKEISFLKFITFSLLIFHATFCISQTVGIGSASFTPQSTLDVKGNMTIGGTYGGTNAAPANGLIVEGNVGIGTTIPGHILDVQNTTTGTASANYYMSQHNQTISPAATSDGVFSPTYNFASITGNQTINNYVVGGWNQVQNNNTGSVGQIFGAWDIADNNSSGTITANAIGTYGLARNLSTGPITQAFGLYSIVQKISTGAITNAFGIYTKMGNYNATGTITNGYGLYIGTPDVIGAITKKYAIIADAGTGNVGIGTNTPTALVQIDSFDEPSITGTVPTGAFAIKTTASTAMTMGVSNASPYEGWIQMRHGTISGIAYPLALNPLGGNVGIGTSNPGSNLHVYNTAGGTLFKMEIPAGGGNFGPSIEFKNSQSTATPDWFFGVPSIANCSDFFLYDNGSTREPLYVLKSNGFVGILKNNPGTALDVNGTITGTVKNFKIPYPGKPGYDLVHSVIEGPEIAVFYRGTARLINGEAKITLPSYFALLTREGSETVLLTAKGKTPFLLSYDNFNHSTGTFTVFANASNASFDWEVKAVRKDQSPLDVEVKTE